MKRQAGGVLNGPVDLGVVVVRRIPSPHVRDRLVAILGRMLRTPVAPDEGNVDAEPPPAT